MKKVILAVLALALVGAGVGYYLWNKPHQDMAAAKALAFLRIWAE